jgi:PadR family transcriptional regulator, regulatory protein PadR
MGKEEVRITVAVAAVLRVFLDEVREPRYGYELMKLTGFASGKLYPILARLQAAQWLEKQREDIDPVAAGRPVRYHYKLSKKGTAAARRELAILHQQFAPASASGGRLWPEGGRA